MLRYFRLHTADRVLAVLILCLLLIGLALALTPPITLPEVQWLVLGERLAGGSLLYRDVWTEVAPLPALILAGLVAATGKHVLSLQIFGGLCLIAMAFHYRRGAGRYQFFTERNVIPVLVYLLLGLSSFDFLCFTPVLLATFFLQMALFRMARHLRYTMKLEDFLILGLQLGLATLCYLPCIIFLLLPVMAFALYTGTDLRQYLLMLLGFVLPTVLSFLLFLMLNAGSDYYYNYIASLVSTDIVSYLDYRSLSYLFAIPAMLTTMAVLQINSTARLINYQTVLLVVMGLYLLCAFGALGISREHAPYQYFLLVPALAFFVTHFFNLIENKWIAEGSFWVLLVGVVLNLLSPSLLKQHALAVIHLDGLIVHENELPKLKGKDVLVLGHDPGYYLRNRLVTPYLNPQLAYRHLHELNDYKTLQDIYEHFQREMPAYVIDRDSLAPALFQRMPVLGQYYKPAATPGVYERVAVPQPVASQL